MCEQRDELNDVASGYVKFLKQSSPCYQAKIICHVNLEIYLVKGWRSKTITKAMGIVGKQY
jgi:hypothetical protein